ncbi:MAG: glycosyltransferase [Pseudomonadota bacterium]
MIDSPPSSDDRRLSALLISPKPVDLYPPVQYQARILAQRGFSVHLVTAPAGGRRSVDLQEQGVSLYAFPYLAASRARRSIAFYQMIAAVAVLRVRLGRGLALEVAFDPPGVVASAWAPGRGQYLVHHHHEVLVDMHRFDMPARRIIDKADLVVAADTDREALLHTHTPQPRATTTVRNVPLTEAATPRVVSKLPGFCVVYAGVIATTQAIDVVIASMNRWPFEATLHLFGNVKPDFKAHLDSIAAECGVSHRVIYEGWVPLDSLLDRLAAHHLALTIIRPENENWLYCAGASNKRFQAMAVGLPQITDDQPSVKALMEASSAGTSVPWDDEDAIAEAVCSYAANPERTLTEGERGRQYILREANYETEFAKVMSFAGLTDAATHSVQEPIAKSVSRRAAQIPE